MDTEMLQSPPQSPAEENLQFPKKRELTDKQREVLALARLKAVESRRAKAAEKQQEKDLVEKQRELEKLRTQKRTEALEAELHSLQQPQPAPPVAQSPQKESPEKPKEKASRTQKKRRVVASDSDTDLSDAEEDSEPPRARREAAVKYQPAPTDWQKAWEEQQAREAYNHRIRQYRSQLVNSSIFPYLR